MKNILTFIFPAILATSLYRDYAYDGKSPIKSTPYDLSNYKNLELVPGFNQPLPTKRAAMMSNPNYNAIQWPWATDYRSSEPVWPSYSY